LFDSDENVVDQAKHETPLGHPYDLESTAAIPDYSLQQSSFDSWFYASIRLYLEFNFVILPSQHKNIQRSLIHAHNTAWLKHCVRQAIT